MCADDICIGYMAVGNFIAVGIAHDDSNIVVALDSGAVNLDILNLSACLRPTEQTGRIMLTSLSRGIYIQIGNGVVLTVKYTSELGSTGLTDGGPCCVCKVDIGNQFDGLAGEVVILLVYLLCEIEEASCAADFVCAGLGVNCETFSNRDLSIGW